MEQALAPRRCRRRIAGLELTIHCADVRLHEALEPWIGQFLEASDPGDSTGESLDIDFALIDAPDAEPRNLERLVEYYYVTGYRHGRLSHFRTSGGAWLEVDPATLTARGAIPVSRLDDPPWALRDLFNAALTTILRARGRYPLHGAALHRPEGGLLIVGSAMAGKTTLAFSLARRSWSWLADDKILLSGVGPGEPEASGLLAHANVDPGLARWFPELKRLADRPPAFPHTTKRAVPLAELVPPDQAPPPAATTPRWLFFPQVVDAGPTRVAPLDTEAAFLELVRQSPLLDDPEPTRRQLELLGRLARSARAYRWLVGRDMLETPARLDALCGEIALPLGPTGGLTASAP